MRIDNPIGINAALTGSFSGSFFGDGSGIVNVAASNVEYINVLNKPALISGSAQIASQISGSFTAVSASIATRFDNLGSGFATDIELSNVSASFANSITDIYNTYATDIELAGVSASLATDVATIYNTYATDSELAVVSASLASKISVIDSTINSLDNTYATDSQLAALSSSLISVNSELHAHVAQVSSSLTTTIENVLTGTTILSGSLANRITNLNTAINNLDSTYATDAALLTVSSSFASTTSLNVQIARLNSGSFASRIDNINTTINNLDGTYATDSQLTNVSSSFATRISANEVTYGNAISTGTALNTLQNSRLAALEAATGSYQAGLTFNDTSGQAGINFTNSAGTITAVATGLGTTDNVTFNNGTFNGSVFIDGNLIVSGSNTSLNVQNLQVADAFIYLNSGSNSTNPDMGFAGNYNDGTYHHAGFFRDASDAGTFKVFENYALEPDASIYIDTTHASFRLAPFAAAKITATSITGSLSGNASTASKWATARTITLGGDLTGNVSIDGSADVTLTATVAANSVALGTDTTGNYVASLVAGTGISIADNTGEGATPTITNSAPDQTVVLTAGSNVSISGTYPNFTIASTDTNTTYTASTGLSLTGTVFSIDSTVVTLSGAQTLTNKTIGGGQLVDASVTNAKLANSSVTVTAGTGLSGGGAVALGSSVTLSNAGVTSNIAGTGISVDQGTGAVTITNSDRGSSQNIFKNVAVSGQTTVVADNNDDTLTFAAGTGITIATNASTDTVTITNSSPDQTVALTAGTNISISGTYPNFTITNSYSLPFSYSTGVTANHVVQRDANGYIYANHINFNTSETENPTINSFFVSNGDGWSRKASLASVRSQLGNYGGWITSSGTAAAVSQTVSGTSTAELVRGNMADNDQFRILVGGTASNAGYVEIATADDGTEPIYARQYTGVFSSLTRTAAILDGSGNTTFPGDVTAYSSDKRLKENVQNIPNALDKVLSLNGVTFDWKQEAFDAGFNPKIKEGDAGVLAQEVQAVLPQAVKPAPFDIDENGGSKSGKDYLTVQYEKLAPLFIEAIKEQQKQIELLKAELAELKNK